MNSNKKIILKFSNSYVNQISSFSFSLNFNKSNQLFMESLLDSNILTGSRTNDNYDKIFFQANNISSFSQFLDYCKERNGVKKITYNLALKIIWCITQQIQSLEKNNFTFFKLDMEHILVIDYEKFIYFNFESIMEINNNNIFSNKPNKNICFFKPFNRSGFISPEISSITSIPCSIDFRSVYYSLAHLIFFLLFEKKINNIGLDPNLNIDLDLELDESYETNNSIISYNNNFNYIQNKYFIHKQVFNELKPIFYTKLYWFLLRNLSLKPIDRFIFFL